MPNNYTAFALPLDMSDTETAIRVDTALEWISQNTTIEIDPDTELPSSVKLFIIKFCDLMSQSFGVASESLGGMSQSFSTTGGNALLLHDLASELFGPNYIGRNKFIAARSRWK